ncbi:MAG: indole-3-glycerol phosphate synthase TrpC [Candidatus Magasanikbacteria bacterium]|nr:indole-3-glycerol phosphate synthase TrpC [Candidatus Magasanikbacteria bacterium]
MKKNIFREVLESKIHGKLREILEYKMIEVERSKEKMSFDALMDLVKKTPYTHREFASALHVQNGVSLIAEIKKASPSEGSIRADDDIIARAKLYESSGAHAISVLTDEKFFGGSLTYLSQVKKETTIPILRKDFIIDPYQVYESKLYGADAILLIATVLREETLIEFVDLAHELGLECLVETHTKEDIEKALKTNARVIGINARDLQTFEIDLENIVKLASCIPVDKIIVAESGIESSTDVMRLKQSGVNGILVGTALMRTHDVEEKIRELMC